MIYKMVIEDVIRGSRDAFIRLGIDEQVLFELQESWETKLLESRVFSSPRDYQQLGNMGNREMHQPLMISGHGPLPTQAMHPGIIDRDGSQQHIMSGYNQFATQNIPRPQLGMHEPSHFVMHPQTHGMIQQPGILNTMSSHHQTPYQRPLLPSSQIRPNFSQEPTKRIPGQFDGLSSGFEDIHKSSAQQSHKSVEPQDEPVSAINQEEDLLGSDLDEDEDEAFLDTNNVILCQYEKATRTKNRWKCSFRDGVLHIRGADYVFHRANGEFEWL